MSVDGHRDEAPRATPTGTAGPRAEMDQPMPRPESTAGDTPARDPRREILAAASALLYEGGAGRPHDPAPRAALRLHGARDLPDLRRQGRSARRDPARGDRELTARLSRASGATRPERADAHPVQGDRALRARAPDPLPAHGGADARPGAADPERDRDAPATRRAARRLRAHGRDRDDRRGGVPPGASGRCCTA